MRKRGFEINLNVLRISRLFIINPARRRCGYEVASALGMHRNTVYDILERLEDAEWLSSVRETVTANGHSSLDPPRRLYRITGKGHEGASRAFAAINFLST